MEQATLQTKDGDFIKYVPIPPFLVLPEVIIWGTRTFIIVDSEKLIYREALPWVVTDA